MHKLKKKENKFISELNGLTIDSVTSSKWAKSALGNNNRQLTQDIQTFLTQKLKTKIDITQILLGNSPAKVFKITTKHGVFCFKIDPGTSKQTLDHLTKIIPKEITGQVFWSQEITLPRFKQTPVTVSIFIQEWCPGTPLSSTVSTSDKEKQQLGQAIVGAFKTFHGTQTVTATPYDFTAKYKAILEQIEIPAKDIETLCQSFSGYCLPISTNLADIHPHNIICNQRRGECTNEVTNIDDLVRFIDIGLIEGLPQYMDAFITLWTLITTHEYKKKFGNAPLKFKNTSVSDFGLISDEMKRTLKQLLAEKITPTETKGKDLDLLFYQYSLIACIELFKKNEKDLQRIADSKLHELLTMFKEHNIHHIKELMTKINDHLEPDYFALI